MSDQFVEDNDTEENYFEIISFKDRIKREQSFNQKVKNVLIKIYITVIAYYFTAKVSGYLLFLKSPSSASTVPNFQFLTALFMGVLLSNIFGSVSGGIGTLIGDIVYQFVSNGTVYWHYTIPITFLAVVGGLYYYKKDITIHKLQIMKIFYLLVGSIIASFFFIIIFVAILYPGYDFETVAGEALVRNAVQFLISEIVTVLFLVPIVILIMDKILEKTSNDFDSVYKLILTHHTVYESDHAIPLKIGGYYLFFCTRCTGMVFGILTALFFESVIRLGFRIDIPEMIALLIALLSAIPGLIDWGTQKLGYRTSTDVSRIITGLLIGTGLHMLTLVETLTPYAIIILTVYFTIFGVLMYFGNRRSRKNNYDV